MTTYQGGKKRIGRRISKVINTLSSYFDPSYSSNYFEPFCGMCGVLQHINNRPVFATDINEDLILLLQHLQKNGIKKLPTSCSKKQWIEYKNKSPSAQRGFIGIVASWGGIFFQGFRLDYSNSENRNYLLEGLAGLEKLKEKIQNVKFLPASSYTEYSPNNFIIYCDPPYQGNKLGNKDNVFQKFDHTEFWNKMRKWSENNIVIISESMAPSDFNIIWTTQSHNNNSNRYKVKKYPDNLYIHNSIFKRLPKNIIDSIHCI